MPPEPTNICKKCNKEFGYKTLNDGFNQSAHAYCDKCGMACVLNDLESKVPKNCNWFRSGNDYRIIEKFVEIFLKSCPCGGAFRHDALPRCPHCNQELVQFDTNLDELFKFKAVIIGDKRVDDWWNEG